MGTNIMPIDFCIYKGVSGKWGAAQFSLGLPHWEQEVPGEKSNRDYESVFKSRAEGWKERKGAVFLDMTCATGKNQYDWKQKINFALSVADMAKVVEFFLKTPKAEGRLNIFHDPGAGSSSKGQVGKSLDLYTKEGVFNAGCMLKLTEKSNSGTKDHTVPLSSDEVIVLKNLFETAIAKCLNW